MKLSNVLELSILIDLMPSVEDILDSAKIIDKPEMETRYANVKTNKRHLFIRSVFFIRRLSGARKTFSFGKCETL